MFCVGYGSDHTLPLWDLEDAIEKHFCYADDDDLPLPSSSVLSDSLQQHHHQYCNLEFWSRDVIIVLSHE